MAEALRRLAAAVKLVIDREDAGDTSGAPAEIRIEADLLEREPLAAHRAEIVRAAFSSAADAAMSLQRRRYPHLQAAVEGLRSAARTIRVDQPLETQQAALQDFLDRASDVLRGMTESR
jgi:hypothetical protein